MKIKTIGVVGAGQMGSGIAQVCAAAGFDVFLMDVDDARIARGRSAIETSLGKFVEKGKLAAGERDAILRRIHGTAALADLSGADLVIEAIVEDRAAKQKIFAELDGLLPKHAILASNTSSIPIADLASATRRAGNVIGMHFMNPVPVMKGVEIIRGEGTSPEIERTILELAKRLGKTPVRSRDRVGFIANRILVPMIREAILALEEGVGEREDIDRCMTDCCNFPMGPLALADLIGLDTCKSIMEVMARGLNDERYAPPKLLSDLVAEGKLGRKNGRGFYDYERMTKKP